MTKAEFIELLTEKQLQKDYSDGEFAQLLGMKHRQAWQKIKKEKDGLTLAHVSYAYQAFPDLGPEVLALHRDYRNGKK